MMRAALLLAVALAAISPASAQTASDGYRVGERRESGIGKYRKLLYRTQGWSVWEVASPHLIYCVATKPGKGQPSALPWEGAVALMAAGGSGFYVTRGMGGDKYYSGFYGSGAIRKSEVIEVDGVVDNSLPGIRLRHYEGKQMRYEITTGMYRNIYHGTRTQSGVIDLTGFSAALDVLDMCLAAVPGSKR